MKDETLKAQGIYNSLRNFFILTLGWNEEDKKAVMSKIKEDLKEIPIEERKQGYNNFIKSNL